jgi:amino acid transporter
MADTSITDDPSVRQPVRDFKFRSAFALSFADLSPIVGIYTVFAIGLIAAGPAFLWAFPLVLIGQLFVCGVFGNLVSKWPLQGSVYAWSRELIGPRYGWFTGWAYMWGLTLTLAVLPITAAPYILSAAGVNSPSQITIELVAIGVLLFGSAANLFGGRLLKGLIYIALVCELVASAGIGITLLLFHHINPLSVIFTAAGTGHGARWLIGPFLLPIAYIAYSFIGFEASASIGEEVQESRKVLPKAVILSLAVGGLLVIVACLGLVLAIPDMASAVSGKDTNPIATTLVHAYGSGAGRTLLIALAIGFASSMIAVQTAVTRAIWASARDRMLPGTGLLGRLSGREHLPRYAIGLTIVIAGALIFAGASKVFALLVSFSAFGFILSYYMPILALGYKQWRRPNFAKRRGVEEGLSPLGQTGPRSDAWGERWIRLITAIALIWLSAEIVNLLWPRTVSTEWYLNWGSIIMTGALGVLGGLICLWSFRHGSPAAQAAQADRARRPAPVSAEGDDA